MAQETHERGVELIHAAFERKRHSGAPEWRRMTVAVLKNRLLDLTDRKFAEGDWGASSFREFLGGFDDIVSIDLETRPPQVVLREDASPPEPDVASAAGSPPDLGPNRRVRGDLWDAVLNYSGGIGYAWDGHHAVALDLGSTESGLPLLPTLTQDEFKRWRADFVQAKAEQDPAVKPRLYDWLEGEQPLTALPPALRIAWVIELKGRVLRHLEAWFRSKSIPPPSDLVVVGESSRSERGNVSALRERVLAAVREMSAAELKALQLPATILLRDGD